MNVQPLPLPRRRGRPRKDAGAVRPDQIPERLGFNDLRALTGWGATKLSRYIHQGDARGRLLPTYLDHSRLNAKGCPCRFWLRSEVLAFLASLTERFHPAPAKSA